MAVAMSPRFLVGIALMEEKEQNSFSILGCLPASEFCPCWSKSFGLGWVWKWRKRRIHVLDTMNLSFKDSMGSSKKWANSRTLGAGGQKRY
jgi:hypothetical protein